jgi:hypothetical protein
VRGRVILWHRKRGPKPPFPLHCRSVNHLVPLALLGIGDGFAGQLRHVAGLHALGRTASRCHFFGLRLVQHLFEHGDDRRQVLVRRLVLSLVGIGHQHAVEQGQLRLVAVVHRGIDARIAHHDSHDFRRNQAPVVAHRQLAEIAEEPQHRVLRVVVGGFLAHRREERLELGRPVELAIREEFVPPHVRGRQSRDEHFERRVLRVEETLEILFLARPELRGQFRGDGFLPVARALPRGQVRFVELRQDGREQRRRGPALFGRVLAVREVHPDSVVLAHRVEGFFLVHDDGGAILVLPLDLPHVAFRVEQNFHLAIAVVADHLGRRLRGLGLLGLCHFHTLYAGLGNLDSEA